MISVSACGNSVVESSSGLCDGTRQLRKLHARALYESTDQRAQATGEPLLTAFKVGCGE